MTLKKIQYLFSLLLLSLALNGFKWFYHPDLQQGNSITEAEITQLREGMTRQETIKILGNPILTQSNVYELVPTEQTLCPPDTSNQSLEEEERDLLRVEYISFYQPRYGKPIRKKLSLLFEDDKLLKFKLYS